MFTFVSNLTINFMNYHFKEINARYSGDTLFTKGCIIRKPLFLVALF